MKRHPGLVLLSQDHHEGLLLATRLQQGRRALTASWSLDPFWQAKYVSTFFKMHLRPHFHSEEEVLFPSVLHYGGSKARELVSPLIDEHRRMEEMISFFLNPDEKKLECTLVQFGEILEHHIRAEERELFPFCQEIIPEEELSALGRLISGRTKEP